MIRLAVFDNNKDNIKTIKQSITKYTVQKNVDFDVLWFYEDITPSKINKYVADISIALIHLELDTNHELGKLIYSVNEDCRIIYYNSYSEDLEPLLCVRSRAFHLISRGEDALISSLDNVVEEIKKSNNYFYRETRKEIIVISQKSIMYFQSDLKYVIINISPNRKERLYAKLSEIEPCLKNDFLRIHKSYIVNTSYVNKINKSAKTVILKNGEVLPISDVNYKSVINYFTERDNKIWGKSE